MDARGPLPEDRQDLEGPRGTTESPRVGIYTPKRRWAASHWGLLLLGILVILILGSVWVSRLVYRDSPEGRLRSYVPESIRETCKAEYTTSLIKIHYVATDGFPTATASLFCFWPVGCIYSFTLARRAFGPGSKQGRAPGRSWRELPNRTAQEAGLRARDPGAVEANSVRTGQMPTGLLRRDILGALIHEYESAA